MTWLIILVVALLVLAALVLFINRRPEDFVVTRSATIPASPAVVFAEVNDFHRWEAWSPWAKMDLNAKNTFEGAPSGQGAIFRWSGNNKVGEGNMTLLESHPSEAIRIQLQFIKPFAATNTVEFTFQPVADGTLMTWTMRGKYKFPQKAVGLFLDCEKLCGGQFEQGLGNLRAIFSQ